jgi:hypothetical protein
MSDNNGRRIDQIRLDGVPLDVVNIINSNARSFLQWWEDYHGQYDLPWVVRMMDGREIERFNVRNIAHIIWTLKPIDGEGK